MPDPSYGIRKKDANKIGNATKGRKIENNQEQTNLSAIIPLSRFTADASAAYFSVISEGRKIHQRKKKKNTSMKCFPCGLR